MAALAFQRFLEGGRDVNGGGIHVAVEYGSGLRIRLLEVIEVTILVLLLLLLLGFPSRLVFGSLLSIEKIQVHLADLKYYVESIRTRLSATAIINRVFQMTEEITLKKDPKKHLEERNQVLVIVMQLTRKMFREEVVVNGCKLHYDTAFGINSGLISNQAQVVGESNHSNECRA